MFNYIVTIHNSEGHLRTVLDGIKNVKSDRSEVYCVLDGCTDGSEAIVDEFGFTKITTNNVRETKAITIALQTIYAFSKYYKIDKEYNLILQDDVVLFDTDIEEHIMKAYKMFPDIGVLSFRHGSNLKPDVLTEGKHSSEMDLVLNICQPDMGIPRIDVGHITERQIVYKSPICISSEVVQKLGGYDSRFEPIAHDDTEYCIRAYRQGYKNYVCGLDLDQPVEWGGTRRFPETHQDNLPMHQAHFDLIRELYPDDLRHLSANHPPLTETKIW